MWSPHSSSSFEGWEEVQKGSNSSCPRKCVALKVKPQHLYVSSKGMLERVDVRLYVCKYLHVIYCSSQL